MSFWEDPVAFPTSKTHPPPRTFSPWLGEGSRVQGPGRVAPQVVPELAILLG